MSDWSEIAGGIWMYRDSCNVYALEGDGQCVIVDAGTGKWKNNLGELPKPPGAMVCTHYFRDHSAGAAKAAELGIPVWVPEGERPFFAEPEEHFRRRETYTVYDNLWDHLAPIRGIDVAGVLCDHETITLCGLTFEIVPLPGATVGQIGLALKGVGDGTEVLFCAEAIHSPGKIARVAPFQYNYNDLAGAVSAYSSLGRIARKEYSGLCPSIGEPMFENVQDAITQTKSNLRDLIVFFDRDNAQSYWRSAAARLDLIDSPPALERISAHVWASRGPLSRSFYVRSDSGKVLAIDYGYDFTTTDWPTYSTPVNRRAMLHDLDALEKQLGTRTIDTVLVSHFHDDHVSGIPLLQRLQGTECWASEAFADLIEHPEAHRFPCTWPIPCRIDRRIPLAGMIEWEEYSFRFAPMSGHTRFAALIGFEADGLKFAHVGDQYALDSGDMSGRSDRTVSGNIVYRNGALLDGYDQSRDFLLTFRPDVILSGHWDTRFTDERFFEDIAAFADDYRDIHRAIMPLADEDTHLNVDSYAGWLWPYRIQLDKCGPVHLQATIRNPHPQAAELSICLVDSSGNRGISRVLTAPAHEDVTCDLSIEIGNAGRRQPIAAELFVDGKPFGQIAEALVTVGSGGF